MDQGKPPQKPAMQPSKFSFNRKINFRIPKKNVTVAVVIIVLIGVIGLFGNATGFATATSKLTAELNSTKESLASCESSVQTLSNEVGAKEQNLDSCNSNLNSAVSSKESCESSKSGLESEISQSRDQLSTCESDKDVLRQDTELYKSGYDMIAENYAIDVCCTRGIQEANWDVVDNAVVCSGNRTVTCS